MRDLSATGAFIATSAIAAETGTKLVLSAKGGFLGMSTYEIEARVIWSGTKHGLQGFGVEFLSNPPQLMELVRRQADRGS